MRQRLFNKLAVLSLYGCVKDKGQTFEEAVLIYYKDSKKLRRFIKKNKGKWWAVNTPSAYPVHGDYVINPSRFNR